MSASIRSCTIRPATLADQSVLLKFHRTLYQTYRDSIMPPGTQELYAYRNFDQVLAEDLESMLQNPKVWVLLAEQGGLPLGYITGHIEHQPRRVLPRRGVVEDWFLLEPSRGRGIGKLLFESLCDLFRQSACDVVESGTWPFNASARRTHDALGFTEVEIKYRMQL